MNKTKARLIASSGVIGLLLAVIGRWTGFGIMMWVGVGLLSVIGMLALISIVTKRPLLPTANEIFSRR